MTHEPGMWPGIPMQSYLAIDALSAGRLQWLAASPLHYRRAIDRGENAETEATALGTALHMAVLEPGRFAETYTAEPDPFELAPDAVKPRATKAYKDACAKLEGQGKIVLKSDDFSKVCEMTGAILNHRHASRALSKARDREVTMLWERDGRLCRGRGDALGDGVLVDVKTTRNLRGFSPYVVTNLGYYRQAGWYVDGARRLGCDVRHFLFIAVENVPPYDVGVFALDRSALEFGIAEANALVDLLGRCEDENEWPGMFPEVQAAQITEAALTRMNEDEMEVSEHAG